MLPVALTCPLWWVARWATRVLTSLAVVAALALGAWAAPGAASSPAAGTFAVGSAVSSHQPASVVGVGHPASAEMTADETGSVRATDPQPAPPGGVGAVPAVAVGLVPAGPTADRLPHADDPASPGPRAPPGR
ncbi:hypothetical protein ACFY2Q_07980 [Micromonospora sp. NPDC000316]|uniref:hypothetical protein n=1 Tax=Micromonospora sp. NPDC000316 TaxID=3364216 RepID=UPI0036CFE925